MLCISLTGRQSLIGLLQGKEIFQYLGHFIPVATSVWVWTLISSKVK